MNLAIPKNVNDLIHVGFAHSGARQIRNLTDALGRYGDAVYGYAADMDRVDWLIAYSDLDDGIVTTVPRSRRIVVLVEPPNIMTYHRRFLDQFGTVIGPIPVKVRQGRVLRTHIGFPWFYGLTFDETGSRYRYTRDELIALPRPDKKSVLTAVLSNKKRTPMQRARLALAERLAGELGDQFLLFGKGFKPIPDKAEAIDGYRYHLAIENNAVPDLFTEKIIDPLIGWSLPVYAGCPNIADYLPGKAYVPIDVEDQRAAVTAIKELLARDPYMDHIDAIAEARIRLLTRYDLLSLIRGVIADDKSLPPVPPVRLRSNKNCAARFNFFKRLIRR